MRRFIALVAGSVALAAGVRAQAPLGSDTLSPTAVAESLAVLRDLERQVRANRDDAATWHRIGMIAWALYERDRHTPRVDGLDWTLLGRQADTSLRLAAMLAHDDPMYFVAAGRFLLSSGVSFTRAGSYGFFGKAMEAARASGDGAAIAETAIEAGRVHWRRYDAFANRWIPITSQPECRDGVRFVSPVLSLEPSRLAASAENLRLIRQRLEEMAMETGRPGFAGEANYLQAEDLFREAFEADPSYERAFRQLAMLLVERHRWRELRDVARRRVESAPSDAWGWMTLGLALHRQEGRSHEVAASFEHALSRLPAVERRRLDRLERILKPADTARVSAADEAERAAINRYYWLTADPVWSLEGNDPRLEFLARVAYAELRWTVEEMRVRGADTDRGDIHIRYGPPDLIAAFGPTLYESNVCTIWGYRAGFQFFFRGPPTFATAHIPFDGRASVEAFTEDVPARWDNISRVRVLGIPLQVARFRGGTDSVDVYIAAVPPVDSIRRSSDVDSPVRTDVWLLEGGTSVVARDSIRRTRAGAQSFVSRVAPGWYLSRVEATADGALLAAASGSRLFAHDTAGFTLRGFGMSDVVLASHAASRSGTASTWRALDIVPHFGAVARGGSVVLVWENYEPASDGGTARYAITLTLERQRSAAGRIAARIVGAVGNAVGIDQSDDRLSIRYERETAHRNTLLENLTLALGATPTGTYRLTVEILDHATGATTSRSLSLTVGN